MSYGIWWSIGYLLIGAIIGGALGFYFTRRMFIKQQQENPPITEKQIRMMYSQMGRKPSEAQIKAIMRSMNSNLKNAK